MKIIFMGTPTFAIPSLLALVNSKYEIQLVISQPDKPNGRGNKVLHTPVKEFCLEHSLPIHQPETIKTPEFLQLITSLKPDVIVTCAYGKIFPTSIIDVPRYGMINVHGSLLPKLRGAAPIQWALINGLTSTGITTMLTQKGIDTGPMLLKRDMAIDNIIQYPELYEKLSDIGASLLLETLSKLTDGTLVSIEQDHTIATHAPMITKDMSILHWTRPAKDIHNLVRGLYGTVCTYTCLHDTKLKILTTTYDDTQPLDTPPGVITSIQKGSIAISTGSGTLYIKEALNTNGKKITTWDNCFIAGKKLSIGDIFN